LKDSDPCRLLRSVMVHLEKVRLPAMGYKTATETGKHAQWAIDQYSLSMMHMAVDTRAAEADNHKRNVVRRFRSARIVHLYNVGLLRSAMVDKTAVDKRTAEADNHNHKRNGVVRRFRSARSVHLEKVRLLRSAWMVHLRIRRA
jgi:hypothetical protein